MKKLISILLVAVMLTAFALPSFAAKTVSFTASDAEVFAGDEITVDIFISDNSLLKTAVLLIKYDTKKLQYLDHNIGAIVTAGTNAVSFKETDNGIQVDYNDSTASLSSAGKFISVTFAVKDDAIGKTNIVLSVSGGKVTTESGAVTPTFKDGEINIINNVVTPSSSVNSQENSSEAGESKSESDVPSSEQGVLSGSTENDVNSSDKSEDVDDLTTDEKKIGKLPIIIAVAVVFAVIVSIFSFNFGAKPKNNKRKKKKKSKR